MPFGAIKWSFVMRDNSKTIRTGWRMPVEPLGVRKNILKLKIIENLTNPDQNKSDSAKTGADLGTWNSIAELVNADKIVPPEKVIEELLARNLLKQN